MLKKYLYIYIFIYIINYNNNAKKKKKKKGKDFDSYFELGCPRLTCIADGQAMETYLVIILGAIMG